MQSSYVGYFPRTQANLVILGNYDANTSMGQNVADSSAWLSERGSRGADAGWRDQSQVNTTVRLPSRMIRSSANSRTARERTTRSMSRPISARSSAE